MRNKRITESYRGRKFGRARRSWRERPIKDWYGEVVAWNSLDKVKRFMRLKFSQGNKKLARRMKG